MNGMAYPWRMGIVGLEGPVESFTWGRFVVSGKTFGKDVRVVGAEGFPWNERKGHVLKEKMAAELKGSDFDVLIIGNGAEGRLECPDSVLTVLRSRGFSRIIVLKTPEACEEYNRLYSSGVRVAMLAHGTC
jgi:hypothetical protein